MSDQHDGVAVQARLIPFPSSISPDAQASLARLVGADGVPSNALHIMPSPDDHAGWMAIKAAADAYYAAAVTAMAGTLRASVETIRSGDATTSEENAGTSSALTAPSPPRRRRPNGPAR